MQRNNGHRQATAKVRSGKSGTALAVCVFLLSCLAIIPLAKYVSQGDASAVTQAYQLHEDGQLGQRLAGLDIQIKAWHSVTGFPDRLAQFQSVFWEPDDTSSLRTWLADTGELKGASVLEVGTGTGLIALWCGLHEAERIVATDINPLAIANAKYNSMQLGLGRRIDFRLVPHADSEVPGPYRVVADGAKFDLVISNPPWEDGQVDQDAAYAIYDTNFTLLDGFLEETALHLKPGGRLLLAYGATSAIQRILDNAPRCGWTVEILDSRELADLPPVFLPGMLLSLTPAQP